MKVGGAVSARTTVLALLVFLAMNLSTTAQAEITATPVDAALLAAAPQAQGWGIAAGDLQITTDFYRAMVRMQADANSSRRPGHIVLLPPAGAIAEAVVIEPALLRDDDRAQLTQNLDECVIRLTREETGWRIETTLAFRAGAPWIELAQSIKNTGARTLELPVADHWRGTDTARLRDNKNERQVTLAQPQGFTVLLAADGFEPVADEMDDGYWHVGYRSGDPLASFLKRTSQRVLRLGRAESLMPIAADRRWNGSLRERQAWFRIAPNAERVIARRLLVATTADEAQQLAQWNAGGKASLTTIPTFDRRPDGAALALKPIPTDGPRSSANAKLSANAMGSNTKASNTKPPAPKPAPWVPWARSTPSARSSAPPPPPKPVRATPANAKPTAEQPPLPLELPDTIGEITKLPPPRS